MSALTNTVFWSLTWNFIVIFMIKNCLVLLNWHFLCRIHKLCHFVLLRASEALSPNSRPIFPLRSPISFSYQHVSSTKLFFQALSIIVSTRLSFNASYFPGPLHRNVFDFLSNMTRRINIILI
jgi:hypothetical protein